jgi:DNA mismatch repair protein MutS2
LTVVNIYPKDLSESLEFHLVLEEVEKRCLTAEGVERVRKIRPMDKQSEITKLLQQTEEMRRVEVREDQYPIPPSIDTRPYLDKLAIEDYVLETSAIHSIRTMAVAAGTMAKFYSGRQEDYPALAQLCATIDYNKSINTTISGVLDKDGNILPNASPELVKIKKAIDQATRDLDKAFSAALKRLRAENKLGDVEESMRNNRRVLGVVSEHKRQVRGIIHDESETGKTAFIEPEAVVHIQNELFELERSWQREVYRIMKEICAFLRPLIPQLQQYQWLLAVMDVNRAKARYAVDTEASLPGIVDEPMIHLYNARHPVLYLLNKRQKKQVVPLNIEMNYDNRIVVISGPNAGGKSVAMKTVGLLQWMAQSGLLIPADDQSKVGIFKTFLGDIGDSQSLEDELSTYSSRLMKMREFLKRADKRSLLLIDEFGTGTDPSMGGAIAEAALEVLNEQKTLGVITTHYANLKSYAENHPGIINASMLYDELELKPAYQLEMGKPGSSYAMEIAGKSGLPEALIEKARSLLDQEHVKFEELLKSVRVEKEHLKLRRRDLEKDLNDLKDREQKLQQRIRKNKEMEAAFQRKKLEKRDEALRNMEDEFRQHMQSLKDAQPADQEAARRKLRQFINTQKKERDHAAGKLRKVTGKQEGGALQEGDLVTLLEGDQQGEITKIRSGKAEVVFGNLKSTVPLSELRRSDAIQKQEKQTTRVQVDLEKETIFELDIRGMDKFTALTEVEKFLDGALVRNFHRVRIIHGVGTGVLREAVHYVVKDHPAVESYETGSDSEAGTGSTIIYL